ARAGGQRFWGATPPRSLRLPGVPAAPAHAPGNRRGKFSWPMNGDWVHEIAPRDLSLQVTKLASAIAYAEAEGWFADSPRRKDWICLTRTGEVIAKAKLP